MTSDSYNITILKPVHGTSQAYTGKQGRPKKSEKSNNITLNERGNSQAYTLRRK